MLKVEETPLAILLEDGLEDMMHAHWRECSIDQREVPFNPDWPTGLRQERDGVLRAYGLFQDGELAGYAIYEVCPHLHFKTTPHAFNCGIYVRPECRKGSAALKLFVESESLLKQLGVKKIVYLAPRASGLNKLLAKGGYVPCETLYSRMVA